MSHSPLFFLSPSCFIKCVGPKGPYSFLDFPIFQTNRTISKCFQKGIWDFSFFLETNSKLRVCILKSVKSKTISSIYSTFKVLIFLQPFFCWKPTLHKKTLSKLLDIQRTPGAMYTPCRSVTLQGRTSDARPLAAAMTSPSEGVADPGRGEGSCVGFLGFVYPP